MVEAEAGKKRKRTGKEREERKRAAIALEQAQRESQTVDAIEEPIVEALPEREIPERTSDSSAVAARIPRALRALNPVFKQARISEVQRLVKKVKFLRTKGSDAAGLVELEAQLSALPHLPINDTISSHILIKLQKHPLFKHSTLPSSISDQLRINYINPAEPSTSSQPELRIKLQNRLCSNKLVADHVKGTVAWLVGEEGAKLPLGKKAAKRPEPSEVVQKRATPSGLTTRPCDAEPLAEDRDAGGEEARTNLDEDDLDDPEDAAADAAGWESGSVSDLGSAPGTGKAKRQLAPQSVESDYDDDDDLPIETFESKHAKKRKGTESAAPASGKKSKKESAPTITGPVTSSTFLPSLSAGFTLGDSDSDPDLDPDIDGSGVVGNKVVRKNRRGQRARQMIWEKKYGKNAKHVQARQRAEEDAQRAVQARSGRGGRGGYTSRGGRGASGANAHPHPAASSKGDRPSGLRTWGGAATMGTQAQVNIDAGARPAPAPSATTPKVHPSWEAARLRKQKEMKASQPQGTKIVFD